MAIKKVVVTFDDDSVQELDAAVVAASVFVPKAADVKVAVDSAVDSAFTPPAV